VLVELEKGRKSTNAVLRLRQFRLSEGKVDMSTGTTTVVRDLVYSPLGWL